MSSSIMGEHKGKPSRPQCDDAGRTVVLDTQFPHFKRTLDKKSGERGGASEKAAKRRASRKSPRVSPSSP